MDDVLKVYKLYINSHRQITHSTTQTIPLTTHFLSKEALTEVLRSGKTSNGLPYKLKHVFKYDTTLEDIKVLTELTFQESDPPIYELFSIYEPISRQSPTKKILFSKHSRTKKLNIV